MINAVVCDDIPVIRDNIVSLIKATYPEIKISGVYFDGQAVLDHLKREKIDLLISDIRMKTVSGIDVLKYITDNNFNTKVIIITAYPEFSYAKDAINFHAAKFITKPINPKEFLKEINDVLNQIKSEKKDNLKHESMTNIIVGRNEFSRKLSALYKENIRFSDFESFCKKTGNPNLTRYLYVVDIKLKSISENSAELSWYDIAECFNSEIDTYIIEPQKSECRIFAFVNRTEKAKEHYFNWLKQVKKTFSVFYKCETSEIYNRFDSVSYFLGPDSQTGKKIVSLLKNTDFNNSERIIEATVSPLSLKQKSNLISYICSFFNDYYFSFDAENITTQEDADIALNNVFEQLTNESQKNYKKQLFEKLQHYITHNFHDPSLSLDSVASAFHFSPSYLSKLFSDYKGISFTNYLTEVRMEYAKTLLKDSSLSIQEVAERCGYNVKYFSRLFSKKVGMIPRQYRNRSVGL